MSVLFCENLLLTLWLQINLSCLLVFLTPHFTPLLKIDWKAEGESKKTSLKATAIIQMRHTDLDGVGISQGLVVFSRKSKVIIETHEIWNVRGEE